MKEYHLNVQNGSSRILVGGALKNLSTFLGKGRNVVVTDPNVRRFHGHLFSDYDCVEIGFGEESKVLDTVRSIYDRFLELEVDRSTFVIGIGGGIVCDITGYAASTYMRGLSFGFVPSTLLAQVDAAIGGKNGVNLQGFKNIVGTFRQPRFVLCDPDLLPTLPRREILCGMAEIVKHALIKSASYFEFLEKERLPLQNLDGRAVFHAVDQSVRIKTEVVQADAEEAGERRLLNFGHTLGHALEKQKGLSHGEAVSLGMVLAARISSARGLISFRSVDRILSLLKNLGLPTEASVDWDIMLEDIRKDKKRKGTGIHFVFLREIGRALDEMLSYGEIKEHLDDLRQSG